MTVQYRSDKSGTVMEEGEQRELAFQIRLDATPMKKPEHFQRLWHLTEAEYTDPAMVAAWLAFQQSVRQAVVDFKSAVETA